MRMTTFSPYCVGSEEIRRSTACPAWVARTAPSCGRRRSAMSNEGGIFTRGTTGGGSARGSRGVERREEQIGWAGQRAGQIVGREQTQLDQALAQQTAAPPLFIEA